MNDEPSFGNWLVVSHKFMTIHAAVNEVHVRQRGALDVFLIDCVDQLVICLIEHGKLGAVVVLVGAAKSSFNFAERAHFRASWPILSQSAFARSPKIDCDHSNFLSIQ